MPPHTTERRRHRLRRRQDTDHRTATERRVAAWEANVDVAPGPDNELYSKREQPDRLAPTDVRVSVVIPARNEARNLRYVFSRLPAGLHQVIIVDGHSVDDTPQEALRLRPDVQIVHQTGKGKGDALSVGFESCTGDAIVMLDADGSTDPSEIPRFIAALSAGADFVKGSRYAQGGGSSDLTPTRRLGNAFLNWLVNSLFGTRYTDLCYGYNAFWSRCLPYIRLDVPGFEVETLMAVRVARAGLLIHEVPSYERPRLEGLSNLSAIRDGLRILRTIMLERLRVSQRRVLDALLERSWIR
jgi:glycosyltransferase involved in cell wall biosynthesis